MKVYLDTSALNRVFDDQSQPRIYLESTAMELVFLLIETREVEIVSSEALTFETKRNPYSDRQIFVESVLQKATTCQVINDSIVERAQELESSSNIKGLDALHLACAEALDVNYFITCDDRLIKKYSGRFRIGTPIEFMTNILSIEE